MKRRKALKGIILFSLGTGILYSCKDKYQAIKDLGLKNFNPLREELDVLALLSETILPLQNIPELEHHTPLPFIFKMMDDIYSDEDKDAFMEGYKNFNESTKQQTGLKFIEMDAQQRVEFVNQLNNEENDLGFSVNQFYSRLKGLNIQYFKTSEYYEKKIKYYEMEPGRFIGDVLVKDLQNRNSI